MLNHRFWFFVLAASCSILLLGCGSSTRQVGEIIVEFDRDADFSEFQTFTVLTPELVPEAEELELEAELFNDQVNDLIIEAMTGPPVCMTYIPPEEVTETNQPDLFAGNGLSRTVNEGTEWRCVGGWWWGVWGWFWNPCLWTTPITFEYEVGSLYLPVGPRPAEGEDAEPVFKGTAWKVLGTRTNIDDQVRLAVRSVFQRWPEQRTCTP
ncbi:MAG TPA: hypothetical protein VLS88_15735 [Polyangiales bacterium]|nr:hypothetical protein [Polyangiales bacterium]